MSDDNVFRFVSLRPPEGSAGAASGVIAPEEDATEFLEEAIAGAPIGDPDTRLLRGATLFADSPRYFPRLFGDRVVPWFREIEALVSDIRVDASSYRERAEALARELAAENREPSWRDAGLKNKVWSSYIASLLVGERLARDTRGLLAVLRLIHGYELAIVGRFDPNVARLARCRAAIPARYLVPKTRNEHDTIRDSTGAPASQPSHTPAAPSSGTDRLRDLLRARIAVRDASLRRLHRVATEDRRRWEVSVESPAGGERKVSPTPKGKGAPITIAFPPRTSSVARGLIEGDFAERDVPELLRRWGLDLSEGQHALTRRLDALIAAELATAPRVSTGFKVIWQGGTFIRLPAGVRLEGGEFDS